VQRNKTLSASPLLIVALLRPMPSAAQDDTSALDDRFKMAGLEICGTMAPHAPWTKRPDAQARLEGDPAPTTTAATYELRQDTTVYEAEFNNSPDIVMRLRREIEGLTSAQALAAAEAELATIRTAGFVSWPGAEPSTTMWKCSNANETTATLTERLLQQNAFCEAAAVSTPPARPQGTVRAAVVVGRCGTGTTCHVIVGMTCFPNHSLLGPPTSKVVHP
jgi:hypothetical protein